MHARYSNGGVENYLYMLYIPIFVLFIKKVSL